MSDTGDASLDHGQGKASPQIEEEIVELLDGDLRETALEFIAYLRTNNMTPRQWFGPHYWRVPYEKSYLCGIVVDKDRLRFWFFSGDYSGELEEGFTKAVQGGVRPCVSCVDDCPKGRDTAVFGNVFSNTCFQFPVQFENPDGSTLDTISGLIEYWKGTAPRSDSWHCR